MLGGQMLDQRRMEMPDRSQIHEHDRQYQQGLQNEKFGMQRFSGIGRRMHQHCNDDGSHRQHQTDQVESWPPAFLDTSGFRSDRIKPTALFLCFTAIS